MSHFDTALRAQVAGDWLTAQQEYSRALLENPDNADALINAAVVLSSSNRIATGIAVARRAVSRAPLNHMAWHNYGCLLATVGRYVEAINAFNKAIALTPTFHSYHFLGLCLYSLGRFLAAIAAYDKALEFKADDETIIDERSNAYLAIGRFNEGFIDNKVRWKIAAAHPFMHSAVPEWKGENLTGKSIAVLHEQGYGDTLQFIRFVPWLKTKFGAAKTIVSMRPSLIGLLKLSGLTDAVVGIHDIGACEPDVKVPMLTVPGYIGLTRHNIPDGPYLQPPLRKRILPNDGQFKIGLVWGGIPMYAADQWRSLDPIVFLPLIDALPQAKFYALQQDERRAQLWQSGLNMLVTDLGDHLKDWLDTAALINELDLLVSVDTAVAHLAGALGKAVAILSPQASCWRWMEHDTTTTPWYRSATLYRQTTQGDWTVPINKLIETLQCS